MIIEEYEWLQKEIYQMVMDKLDFNKDLSDEEIVELIDEVIVNRSKTGTIEIDSRGKLKQDVFYAIRKLDVLQQFLENPNITEIMVNGENHIFIEEDGTIKETGVSLKNREKLENLITQIVSKCNRRVN